jgi:hypothetical protein
VISVKQNDEQQAIRKVGAVWTAAEDQHLAYFRILSGQVLFYSSYKPSGISSDVIAGREILLKSSHGSR